MTARTTAHLATELDNFYSELIRVRGDRLWSTFPSLRPIATITQDTSTGMGGTKMVLGCTTSSARDATPTPTCY